jgi:hypothetical protein
MIGPAIAASEPPSTAGVESQWAAIAFSGGVAASGGRGIVIGSCTFLYSQVQDMIS